MNITSIDISGLEILSNPYNLHKDVYTYFTYCQDYGPKRTHRNNSLSKSDSNRLAKILSSAKVKKDVEQSGSSSWFDFVDELALKLDFVMYDTKGVYAGYSSSELSFPDNYIEPNKDNFREFLNLSLLEQEHFILNKLIDDYSYENNEFLHANRPLSRLDSFDYSGCACYVLPQLDFARGRRQLFMLLGQLSSDTWYSVQSLIQYLKRENPFFLIPKDPQMANKMESRKGRYANFKEYRSTGSYNRDKINIQTTDSDAFERVEGRYIERFLEGIMLTLGYVDVAYGHDEVKNLSPSINILQAFKLNPRFFRVINNEIKEPQVTVQPNFEIHIESEIYPGKIIDSLFPLTKPVADDRAVILKLDKSKVTSHLADQDDLDVISLIKGVNCRELPHNVVAELEEWTGHADLFTLYTGFSLIECESTLQVDNKLISESLSPNILVTSSPQKIFSALEKAELAPLMVKHNDESLKSLPKIARTVFHKVSDKVADVKKEAKKIIVKKKMYQKLYFPSEEIFTIFRKGLLGAFCVFEADNKQRTITICQTEAHHLKSILNNIKKDYKIRFNELV